ncbi:RNA 2',3'-cyclic phosphodiesterase [Oerskovia sp. KBS0722]|uniref:RNA 2',3'-cyclic phosphodiesterase n=1 Tax=Oerskovia sp. KBS0722 TaxID=1179673 RepID=UPI00110F1870|nr:RNA 2',3'-cyclic phosphodiesterase [Oerskovia sp. KBS0722]QDW63126.1 RNA 2',3'-cyclic phosphodiesterase [Oerskovia sp. KBS0722]
MRERSARLFAALYPSDEALDHLGLALSALGAVALDDGRPSLRWTPRDLMHLTVAFLGEVAEGAADDLAGALDEVARGTEPLSLHLRGAGTFEDRILFAGVGGDAEALRSLSAATAEAASDVGLRLDRRPRQRAHLTVARASGPRRTGRRRTDPQPTGPGLAELAHALAVYEGPRFTADELCLVESTPGAGRSGGPLCEVVRTFGLGEHH